MTLAQQQFLELLRAGLWGRPADVDIFMEVDWKAILKIAKEQTVEVIIADGIETLPEEIWPPKELVHRLMMVRVKTAQMHQLLNSVINKITLALNAEGIPSALLKGQGVAQNYLLPESRMCGDIDLYVGKENYEKACETIKALNPKQQEDTLESEMHMHLEVDGVSIEVHRIATTIIKESKTEAFDQWTKAATTDLVKPEDYNYWQWDNNGTAIQLPESTYNSFFILYHAFRHMMSEGIGFRHICDWTMFLYRHRLEIDSTELQARLKEFGMVKPWKEFSILAHKVLELPEEYIPLYPERHCCANTSSITKHIFANGNFGQYSTDKRSTTPDYMKRKWHNFWFQMLRLFKLSFIFPAQSLSHGWNWITGALRRLRKGE